MNWNALKYALGLLTPKYALGLLILAYATYAIGCHLVSIFKYKARIVLRPSDTALNTFWKTGDDIWWCPMVIVCLLFTLGLALVDFFGLCV